MRFIKDTGYSKVWEKDGFIWKSQPKYLMDNEVHALTLLVPDGWVPEFERVELELLRMQKLINAPVTDPAKFSHRCHLFYEDMRRAGLRHGDLTRPHIFTTENNWPMFIDWGESRVLGDPRPDKRREGDMHWIQKTVREILKEHMDHYGR
jgi:RIO-like serine/threonine protein kinase